jgi:hypothetical protein
MQRIKCLLVTLLFLSYSLSLASCGGGSSSGSPSLSEPRQSLAARQYLAEFLDIIQSNALTRNSVDWGHLISEINALAADAQSIEDTYPAITRALELIGTNHSFLNAADGSLITYPSNIFCEQSFTMQSLNESDIGYVRVDGNYQSGIDSQQIADEIQNDIANQDNQDVTRWIVDLRNNLGGNMYPMIAGLGPLFDQSILGYFIDANENSTPWGYRDGSSFLGGEPVVQVSQPYTVINPLPKIAVLVSKRTASSGEATLLSFKQQFNVRFFGTDSCGLSTGNSRFQLSNGSELFLTTGTMADRNQFKYGERIPVDQQTGPEEALLEAVAWLKN